MLRIGLTGGIAAGKSAVTAGLGRLGALIVDADLLARAVVAPGTAGLDDVIGAFGRGVLGPDGALDRPALGRIVFGDAAARERLNGIVHPRVRAEAARLIEDAPSGAVVVEDIPLLVETHQTARFHLVLVVDAPDDLRIARMIEQRGMDRAEAEQRIRAQVARAERLAAADAVLANEGTMDDLLAATDALWHSRIAPFAENLAAGRPAEGRGALRGRGRAGVAGQSGPGLTDPADPAGPRAAVDAWGLAGTRGLAARTAARLTAALPDAVAVDMIGADLARSPAPAEEAAPVTATLPIGVVAKEAPAPEGAHRHAAGAGPTDDVVRADLRVRLGPDADAAAMSDAVAAAGYPRAGGSAIRALGHEGAMEAPSAVLHRSADPAVDVTVTVTAPDAGTAPDGPVQLR